MKHNTLNFSIVWFKRDLRVFDHKPLTMAVQAGFPIVPLYIIEPDYWKLPDVSRRHWCFIHDSLNDLNQTFIENGGFLSVQRGDVLSVFEAFRSRYGKFNLYSHQETGNKWTFARDKKVKAWCKEHEIVWNESQSNGVIRGSLNRDHWASKRNSVMKEPTLSKPLLFKFLKDVSPGLILAKDHLLFGDSIVGNVQQGGRSQGLKVLESFLKDRGQRYLSTISKPGISARNCSRLSAHIAYGTLSIREIEHATYTRIKELSLSDNENAFYFMQNLSAFLSRLAWRCHFVQKLEQQPSIEYACMHSAFEGMREDNFNPTYFEAWKMGKTGYPLIDACMRSLHQKGWITFRMRAMLVSFASYHLWLDWRVTAPFMAKLFTDFEPGIHYCQFQMQSGVTGINAIRVYNPIKQSLEHDPDGNFIRRYVPELKEISNSWIHEPWRNSSTLKQYTPPIVDHVKMTRYAKDQIKKRWNDQEFKEEANKIKDKLASRKQNLTIFNLNKQKIKDGTKKQLELKF